MRVICCACSSRLAIQNHDPDYCFFWAYYSQYYNTFCKQPSQHSAMLSTLHSAILARSASSQLRRPWLSKFWAGAQGHVFAARTSQQLLVGTSCGRESKSMGFVTGWAAVGKKSASPHRGSFCTAARGKTLVTKARNEPLSKGCRDRHVGLLSP